MNFSATKQNGLTKKCVVRAFKVNTSSTNILFDQIASSSKFVVGAIVPVSSSKHIKLKEFSTSGNMHYLHFAMYNPKEQVSITPKLPTSNDLLDVENLDSLHAFLLIKGNSIASLMQISMNFCEVKIATLLEQFGVQVKPSAILKKDVIKRIKQDGFKALHVNVAVDESDFVKNPSFFDSMLKNEPAIKAKGITGHLTIDAKGNTELASSIENNTNVWINDLDSDFYLETKKGETIKGDDLKVFSTYFTVPYGSKTINAKYAKEILEDFAAKEL
ncbi:hypothetical protein GZ051_17695 [Klebsiella oxytoca]|uniref:hypothetical protein n=1 Tax=Klebsiella TaxID=570 RepID=UPI00024FE442|nr:MULTISPECIES: hypothetical protein [Klebsiella]EHT05882.1 hypothetical protein HMPREF9694_05430 [Klebsiella michiganensis]MBK0677031.1 hypothetical protein [Klebsiella oxytoca]VUS59378.1 hypothetical protein SB6424_00227 [Klebsiella pasteurii]